MNFPGRNSVYAHQHLYIMTLSAVFGNTTRFPIWRATWILGIFFGLVLTACNPQQSEQYTVQAPDLGSRAEGSEAMVSSAHPLASEAGKQMLEQGGNAVDAAVATAFALNVVEPNMSGVGGGGSMLIWRSSEEQAEYVDFYAAKRAETYRDVDHDAVEEEFNLLSTAIPGSVEGLLEALERHGSLSREEVMQPAIDLAENGFPVYLKLAQFIESDSVKLNRYEEASRTFWPDGEPLAPGEQLRQPELAETLARIQQEGRSGFYEGPVAEAIVETLNEAGNPATLEDFSNYEAQWDKNPLCGSYHNNTLLSAPPPQTGAQIIETLHLLDDHRLKDLGLPTQSAEAFDVLTSALRVGMADRGENITDPRWEQVPATGMVSSRYAEERGTLVATGSAADSIQAGSPSEFEEEPPAEACEGFDVYRGPEPTEQASRTTTSDDSDSEETGRGETTHVSVVDQNGNAVSMSATLSPVFGSGARVEGVLLNSSGYDFENTTEEEFDAGPSYRTRASTISPTIVLDSDNQAQLVIGAPGGGRIPTAVIQNMAFLLDYELDPLEAVRMPRIFPSSSSDDVQIEDRFESDVLRGARQMGYDLQALSPGYARIYLVHRQNGRWVGVSDPRHDGQPRGF